MPPVLLVVLVLAYIFQERAADVRMRMDEPEDPRVVRLGRGVTHAGAVLCAGFVSPFGGSILWKAMMGDRAELSSLGKVYTLLGTLALFLLAVASIDKMVDAVSTFIVAKSHGTDARHLRIRDVLYLEIPDAVLLLCVMCVVLLS
jgi:hypothetical protein